MNTPYRHVPTEFGPETKFEIRPLPATPFRWTQETDFERLKGRLLTEKLESTFDYEVLAGLRRAANEASELAKLTAYPLLVFPSLFEEKAENLERYVHRLAPLAQRGATHAV